jgi:DNA-binding CsgD family transcriptional regulator
VADETPRELTPDTPAVGARIDLLYLHDAAERAAKVGSWEWLPRSDTQLWSDNLYRLFGLEPGEVAPTRDYILQRTHPGDRERVMRYVESTRRMSNPPPIEYRIQHHASGIRHLRSTIATVESDASGPMRIVGAVQDVTDEHLTVREITAHLAVSKTLSDWGKFDDPIIELLCELARALELVFATLWLPRGDVLVPSGVWSEPALELGELEEATSALRLLLGIGLPGRVWRSRQPETLDNVAEDEAIRRRLIARRSGLRGAVAFPAVHSDEVVAVFEFYHCEDAEQLDRLRRTMVAIGYELGEFFSRRGGQLGSQHLTARQLDVLRLAAAGNTTPQIAAELHLSTSTVRTHFDHLYEKLRVSSRTAAVAQGLRLGLID